MSSDSPMYDSSNLFEFRTTQCKPIKTLFDVLKENMSDVNIYFTKAGMRIYSIDPSQTVLINVELEADSFDHYYCREEYDDKGQPIPILINVSVLNLNRIFKGISATDNIMIWTYSLMHRDNQKENTESLNIIIASNAKGEDRYYKVTLQDTDDQKTAVVGDAINEYPIILTMPCSDFQKICRDLKNINTTDVKIEYKTHDNEHQLVFSSMSDIAESSLVRTGHHGDEKANSETAVIFKKLPESGVSCYSDDFNFESLHNFSKCANIGSKGGNLVKIHLSEENPMGLVFKIGTLGEILFVLAPKEDEDE